MNRYAWGVIGAGAAGIAAVGKLLDQGVNEADILWIDPAFAAGDLGAKWRGIPSNTKVKSFLRSLQNIESFHYDINSSAFAINQIDHEQTCLLDDIADPLCAITKTLQARVNCIKAQVVHMKLEDQCWRMRCDNGEEVEACSVVMATGAEPKRLTLTGPTEIPFADSMVSERLSQHTREDDVVAVFGSSHSAVLVLRALAKVNVAQVINFYRSPLRYAVDMGDWILFDNTGLKGTAAEWARAHLDGNLPTHFMRVYSNSENIEHHLPSCTKVIYAVGFEPRINIDAHGVSLSQYQPQTGVIAPGLFGFGIAYPQEAQDPVGNVELRVGIWKFMDYLNTVMPIWMRYANQAHA